MYGKPEQVVIREDRKKEERLGHEWEQVKNASKNATTSA